jgi:cytochrome c-type biogenesis protein CcmH
MTESIQSLRDQLLQLKSLHDAGDLRGKAYETRRAVLERKLADLVTAGAPIPVSPRAAAPAAPRPSRSLVVGATVLVVGIALAGYWWTGSPGAIGAAPEAAAAGDGSGASHSVDKGQIAAMTEKLAARLKDKPDDVEGWTMLGRSYMVLEKPAEAVAAYAQAVKLRPEDAGVLADYADALAVQNGRDLAGEPTKLIERALKADPDNLKALMLAGTAAFNRADYALAVKHWERMGQVGPADHPLVQASADAVAEARRRGNLPPAAGAAAPAAAPMPAQAPAAKADERVPAAAGAAVAGTVTLSAELKTKVSPEDVVFVFARPAEGSRMPLAILRKQVKDLPLQFSLDDSMAMSPAAKISTAGRVVVGARVSKSGQAMPQPGDLEGFSAPVTAGANGIKVEISTLTK